MACLDRRRPRAVSSSALHACDQGNGSPLFQQQADGGAMGLDMGAVEDHGAIVGMHAGKLGEDAMEHAFLRPAPKTVVEGLVRAIGGGCVLPAQTIADDMNDAADDPAIIHTWNAPGIGRKIGFDTGELFFRKPEKIATGLGRGWTFPDKSMP